MQFIRPNELRQMQFRDIDIAGREISVRGEVSKTKKTQSIRIAPQMIEIIANNKIHIGRHEHYIFGKGGKSGTIPHSINAMGERMRKILRKLGYPKGYCLYSWKHTGAQLLARAGVPIKQIQEQLRHSSLQETEIYLKGLGFKDFDEKNLFFPNVMQQNTPKFA
jgi:integrase